MSTSAAPARAETVTAAEYLADVLAEVHGRGLKGEDQPGPCEVALILRILMDKQGT